MSDLLAQQLAELLADHGWVAPTVEITGLASGGAQRETMFIEIHSDGRTDRAVAQVCNSVVSTGLASLEAILLRAADAAGVVVPKVLASTDNLAGTEAPALIVAHLDGLSIPRQVLRSLTDAQGDAVAVSCGQSLAKLHEIQDPKTLGAFEDPAKNLFAAYCDALSEGLDELPAPHPAIRLGINWLRRHEPSPPPQLSIVHGDFRTGNLLVADGALVGVLDWELAHLGDPMEDLAYFCMRTWRFGADDRVAGGMGTLSALQSGYVGAGGEWRDDAFDWWTVARTVWWATGLAAQAAASSAGLTDSIVLAASGRRVVELEYDLLRLIDA